MSHRSLLRGAAVLVALVVGTGCGGASSHLYRPSEGSGAELDGLPAAHVAVPAASPRGDVRVMAFGLSQFEDDAPHAVHVRFVVANHAGQSSWVLDSAWVKLALRDAERRTSLRIRADAGARIVIPPGEERFMDLQFPLPELPAGSLLPAFDVLWSLDADGVLVAERTSFERFDPGLAGASALYDPYGPFFWAGPGWGFGTFGGWHGGAAITSRPRGSTMPTFGRPPGGVIRTPAMPSPSRR